MIDKQVIRAYKDLQPSPALRQRVMEQAQALDAARAARRTRAVWRPMLAAAACLFLLLGSLALLNRGGDTGLRYDGQALTRRSTALEPVTVAYRESPRAAVYRRDRPLQPATALTAENCVPFSLTWEGDALLTAEAGAILLYEEANQSYLDAGPCAAVSGGCRFCWRLPEPTGDAQWRLAAQGATETLTLTVTYDRASGELAARAQVEKNTTN